MERADDLKGMLAGVVGLLHGVVDGHKKHADWAFERILELQVGWEAAVNEIYAERDHNKLVIAQLNRQLRIANAKLESHGVNRLEVLQERYELVDDERRCLQERVDLLEGLLAESGITVDDTPSCPRCSGANLVHITGKDYRCRYCDEIVIHG